MKYDTWKELKIQLTALRRFCEELNDSYTHDLALTAIDNCCEILQKEDFEIDTDPKDKEIF